MVEEDDGARDQTLGDKSLTWVKKESLGIKYYQKRYRE